MSATIWQRTTSRPFIIIGTRCNVVIKTQSPSVYCIDTATLTFYIACGGHQYTFFCTNTAKMCKRHIRRQRTDRSDLITLVMVDLFAPQDLRVCCPFYLINKPMGHTFVIICQCQYTYKDIFH